MKSEKSMKSLDVRDELWTPYVVLQIITEPNLHIEKYRHSDCTLLFSSADRTTEI